MFRYNDNGKLISSMFPIEWLTLVTLTEQELNHCIGFNSNGQPLYNEAAIQREIDTEKEDRIKGINQAFDNECKNIGTIYKNKMFQFDDTSRARLLEVKDDSRVTFWRSVDNKNIPLTNAEKNELYEVLKFAYYTKFETKSEQIDAIWAE